MSKLAMSGFVRAQLIEERSPPSGTTGVMSWLKKNLFSSRQDAVLTVLGIALVLILVIQIAPWFLHGVWDAESLKECRSIIAAAFVDHVNGACFAVIKARWHQFLFGLYPAEEYWRPVLAFVLLFPALAPVLFTQLPRKWLAFSAFYPFAAVWLLWGGALSAIVTRFALLCMISLAFRAIRRFCGAGAAVLIVCMGFVLGEWLAANSLAKLMSSVVDYSITPVSSDRFGGFMLSVIIGVSAILGSLPIGILLALGRMSSLPVIKTLCVLFIEFIRGVPLIALLFTASLLLQYFMPPGTNFDLILRVCILVTLFSAAYIAEIIRGALAAISRGQKEAAQALGLKYWPTQWLIVLPQALKISIPGIVSSFIDLFKDTTLVAFVGLLDPLVGVTAIVRSDFKWKGIYWEPYIFVGAIFFVSCFCMARYADWLERKLKTDAR